jgi:hypothetical protein
LHSSLLYFYLAFAFLPSQTRKKLLFLEKICVALKCFMVIDVAIRWGILLICLGVPVTGSFEYFAQFSTLNSSCTHIMIMEMNVCHDTTAATTTRSLSSSSSVCALRQKKVQSESRSSWYARLVDV